MDIGMVINWDGTYRRNSRGGRGKDCELCGNRGSFLSCFYVWSSYKKSELEKQISKTICVEIIVEAMKLNEIGLKERIKRKN